jgi:short-subunit dehydrogenase
LTCTIAALDVRNHAANLFLQQFDVEQPIDLLILNAGILDGRRAGEVVEQGCVAEKVLSTNLLAMLSNLHAVLPAMRARKRGTIVLVSSLAAFVPLADAPAYSASKSALVSYGLALRQALKPEGVKVVVACPGFVETPMAHTHIGYRPGEVSASRAAEVILSAIDGRRGLVGFPASLYWLSRVALLVPERWRYYFTKGNRFHVQPASSSATQ